MAFGEDRERAFSLKGSVVDLAQSLANRPDARSSQAISKSASSIEADVENAMAALRRIGAERSVLQHAIDQHEEESQSLRRLVDELRIYKDDAKRELTAAAKMLTAEQERATMLERNLRASEARARSLEEWNGSLRSHLDSLIGSILETDPNRDEADQRSAARN